MNTAKRALLKVAVVGTLAVGIVGGLPMAVSAEPNEMSCHGLWMSPIRQGYIAGKQWTPHLHAEAFGGTPGDLSEYVHNVYCGQYFVQE